MQDAAVAVPPDERRLRVQTRFEPGDCILDDQLVPASQSRRRLATLLALRAGESNASAAAAGPIDPKRFARLQNRMLRNLRERAPRLLRQRSLTCRIDLDDHADASLFVQASRTQVVVEACEATRIAPLVVRLRADVLESWLTHVAGYRSITTAGGARWRLRRDHLADAWLLVEVIGRRTLPPTWTQNLSMWLLHPRRAFDIWCQRKRRRCPVEPDIWERIDPYELLQPQPEREPLRRTG